MTALVKYSAPGHPDVRLHDVGLAARLRDHEVAGMGDRGAENRVRQKDEVNRVRDGRPSRDPDERAVFEERRVDGGEGVAVTRDLREMRLRRLRVLGQNVLQAGHFEASGPRSGRGERSGILAVDEDELNALSPRERGGVRALTGRLLVGRQLERHLPDRRDVRVPPRFVVDGGEAHVAEPVHADPANLGQPAGIARRRFSRYASSSERSRPVVRVSSATRFHHEIGTGCVFAGGSFSSQA